MNLIENAIKQATEDWKDGAYYREFLVLRRKYGKPLPIWHELEFAIPVSLLKPKAEGSYDENK